MPTKTTVKFRIAAPVPALRSPSVPFLRHWFEAERELMETAKQEREQRSGVRNGKKPVNRIKHSDKGAYPHEESTTKGERDMSRTVKAHKEAAIHESITR